MLRRNFKGGRWEGLVLCEESIEYLLESKVLFYRIFIYGIYLVLR